MKNKLYKVTWSGGYAFVVEETWRKAFEVVREKTPGLGLIEREIYRHGYSGLPVGTCTVFSSAKKK